MLGIKPTQYITSTLVSPWQSVFTNLPSLYSLIQYDSDEMLLSMCIKPLENRFIYVSRAHRTNTHTNTICVADEHSTYTRTRDGMSETTNDSSWVCFHNISANNCYLVCALPMALECWRWLSRSWKKCALFLLLFFHSISISFFCFFISFQLTLSLSLALSFVSDSIVNFVSMCAHREAIIVVEMTKIIKFFLHCSRYIDERFRIFFFVSFLLADQFDFA